MKGKKLIMSQKLKDKELRGDKVIQRSRVGEIRWFLVPCLNGYNSDTSLSEYLALFLDGSREPIGDGQIATILELRP